MQVRTPIMIQDPKLSGFPGLKRIIERPYMKENGFHDGPACPCVVVRNVDPVTGKPSDAVPLQAPAGGRRLWRYAITDPKDIYAPDFMAVSVFGTVLHTMRMFEEEDTLGRPVTWGFPSPQLLINPRQGRTLTPITTARTTAWSFTTSTIPTAQGKRSTPPCRATSFATRLAMPSWTASRPGCSTQLRPRRWRCTRQWRTWWP